MTAKRMISFVLVMVMLIAVLPASARADTTQNNKVIITDNSIIGQWASEGDAYKSYDGSLSTRWNPQASGYEEGEGIIYTLDHFYDLSRIQITFSARYHYFNIFVSKDGENYTPVASVEPGNQYEFYTNGYVCTVDNISAGRAKYVKILFTGAIDNSIWVNFYEIEIYGEKSANQSPETTAETPLSVAGSQLLGQWAIVGDMRGAYDGADTTRWNPQAKDFASGEGIVFVLNQKYSLSKMQIVFASRYQYFDLLVSENGTDYIKLSSVTDANYTNHYSNNYVCTIPNLSVGSAQYVKLLFTGSSDNGKWINFYEIRLFGGETYEKPPVQPSIIAAELTGSWTAGGDNAQSFDGITTTRWNPQAVDYLSNEGIIFTLKEPCDIGKIEIVMAYRYHYFEVFASSDGINYSPVAAVTAENQSSYYIDGYTCTINGLNASNVKQIKLCFTGSSDGGTWINFYEIFLSSPATPSFLEKAVIISGVPTGGWSNGENIKKAYDGDPATRWNPQASDFASDESAVFELERACDLSVVRIVFGKRYHYIQVFASHNGVDYTQIADVNASNYQQYYLTDYVCTIGGLDAQDVRYIKVTYTGNASEGFMPYMNFDEIEVLGSCSLIKEWNLTLTDDIRANFFLNIPKSDASTSKVKVTVGDNDTVYNISQMGKNSRGYYEISVGMAAAQMTEPIILTYSNTGEEDVIKSYTVRQYADALLAEKAYSQYHLLIKEMLNYGAAAQLYFDTNTEKLANDGIIGTGTRDIPITTQEGMNISGNVSGVQFYGSTLVFEERIAARFYFNISDSCTFRINKEPVNPQKKDGLYMIELSDIYPQDLDEYISVDVSNSKGQVLTVTYSPLNYVGRMGEKGSETLREFLKALYNYHLAAEELLEDTPVNSTGQLAGVDDLGRSIIPQSNGNAEKTVGIFYFLWEGSGANDLHDVSKILENDPNAAASDEAWLKAGGGAMNSVHWWGESLFGYFFSVDSWVAERDVMMLTDAGVDFLAVDTSNAATYPQQLLVLLKALDKYHRQGYDVPKVTFITKSESGDKIMKFYKNFYLGHPEYNHLWYRIDGKPLMIGCAGVSELTRECRDYFTFRYSQWPREAYNSNGFPWMDFGIWTDDGMPAVFGDESMQTIMSVSVAQHSGTLAFSSSAFYGDTTNHTRSWHNGANDPAWDAYLYGYNFAEQFDYAISQDPDIIFITGWNEWIAGRAEKWTGINGEITEPVILVDNANINNSRDIQPMKGGYGDNYYMQMIQYIRKFKGDTSVNTALNTAVAQNDISIDVQGSIEQWNKVAAYYLDYTADTEDRYMQGYGGMLYTDYTGRNDIYQMKLTNDSQYLYAYVRTADAIEGMDGDHCLSMFISTGNSENWCGYDFVVGRKAAADDGLVVEKRTASGWEIIGTAKYSIVQNELQFAIDLSLLGLSAENISIQFKFADNYQGEDDIYSFYLNGDAAPYGRLNYVYENKD